MKKILPILFLAFILRIYGHNWDQGFHLHPDERMLIMVADRINFFNNLNPNFFNYGSWPIYIVKGTAQLLDYFFSAGLANYDGMLRVGRSLSAITDTFTIFLIYKITLKLFSREKIALFASFFYAIAFFTIQNSHFFVVDVFLNAFTTLLVFLLLNYLIHSHTQDNKFHWKSSILIGLAFAAMMATKFTAVVFLLIIILVLIRKSSNLITNLIIFSSSFLIFYFLFMPYAFLDFTKFKADILTQLKMNSDPYIFPYTLQYVGTIPYLYYLKNIFLWGMGPIISILSVIGILVFVKKLFLHRDNQKILIIFFLFSLLYFLVIGRSSVKFMRYMLPIYPFLTIMAGVGLNQILKIKKQKHILKFIGYFIIVFSILWTLMFINIYSQQHTRITATEWILKNIPKGKNIATEHWDDRLPLINAENYNFIELTLYDLPDNEFKWQIMDGKLISADYIILASNRLYTPLQRLKNCQKYKVCYPKTTQYYQDLFSGKLGFQKVAEFTAYPKISIGNLQWVIDDSQADESFTVYDHPKIMIFKKA